MLTTFATCDLAGILSRFSLLVVCFLGSSCDSEDPRQRQPRNRDDADANVRDANDHDAALEGDAVASAQKTSEVEGGWRPLHADEVYAGKTLSDWAAEWVRWDYSQTSCDDPMYDKDGSQCGLYDDPDSPVFFLATGEPGTDRSSCAVPNGKAILAPLAVIAWDNAGVPEEFHLTTEELEQEVRDIVATLTGMHLRIDDYRATDLDRYRIEVRQLEYTVPPEPNWFSCNGLPDVQGKVGPAFVGGAFVLLPPPSTGTHRLEYGGALYVGGVKSVNEVAVTLHVD